MGGDGGSIPGRADVVKTSGMRFARNLGGMGYLPNTQVRSGSERYRRLEAKQLQWTTCALTQEPLKKPIVACRLGQLYKKEALLQRLMRRKKCPLPENVQHVRSLRDLRDVKVDVEGRHLVCPLTKTVFDGGTKGIIIWSCGCVITEKAFQLLSKQSKLCPNCDIPFVDEDVVYLNPEEDKLKTIKAALQTARTHIQRPQLKRNLYEPDSESPENKKLRKDDKRGSRIDRSAPAMTNNEPSKAISVSP